MPEQIITEEFLTGLDKEGLNQIVQKHLWPVCPYCGEELGESIESMSIRYETPVYETGSYDPFNDEYMDGETGDSDGDIDLTCPMCFASLSDMPQRREFIMNRGQMTEQEIEEREKETLKRFTDYWYSYWIEEDHKENTIEKLLALIENREERIIEQPVVKTPIDNNNRHGLISNRNTNKTENYFKCECNYTTILTTKDDINNAMCQCGYEIQKEEFKLF